MKRKPKVKESKPEPIPDTCAMQEMPFVPPDSDAVKLTKQIQNLVDSIESYRRQISYHNDELTKYKTSLGEALMNHQESSHRLASLLSVPQLLS